jgi:ABC-2 type transport system permease protein
MTMDELRRTFRGAYTVWYRDVLGLLGDRARLFGSLLPTVIMLVGLGFGLGSLVGRVGGGGGVQGIPYIQFMFPGLLCLTAVGTALQSTLSIVWDREFGFLRKILVAPVSRTSVAVGKVAGGVTLAIVQAGLTMIAAPFLGLRLGPVTIVLMLLTLLLLSACVTALGVLVAARQKSMQGFQVINLFVMMPMMLLTFGSSFLPSFGTGAAAAVFHAVSQVNPVAYAIDALRQIALPGRLPAALVLHPVGIDAFVLGVLFVLFLAPGVLLFSKQD